MSEVAPLHPDQRQSQNSQSDDPISTFSNLVSRSD